METTPRSPTSEDKQSFNMIDVGGKVTTHRRAQAEGTILLSEQSFLAIQNGTNPKGNVLAIAEVAGIQAAKNTSQWIPLCHPLPLDQAKLWFTLSAAKNSVTVFCEVSCSAKTGVEMEALCGVQAALLTLYDLSKAVDPVLTITDIRLNRKEGGKQGVWTHPYHKVIPTPSLQEISFSVITVSDRVSQGLMIDRSGKSLVDRLLALEAKITSHFVVADDKDQICRAITTEALEKKTNVVLLTGGTGLGPRDVTPEAVISVSDKIIPGFGELLRQEGSSKTPMSWLSRSIAGLVSDSIVIALPGSEKGAKEGLETLIPLFKHALQTAKGGNHDKPT